MAGRSEGLNLLSFVPSVTVPPRTAIMPSISSIEVSFDEVLLLHARKNRVSTHNNNICFKGISFGMRFKFIISL